MKFIKYFLILIISALLFGPSSFADKVYSSGGSTTTQTYKSRNYVNRIANPAFDQISAMGLTDVTVYHVVGENADVDATDDIWDGGAGSYNYTVDATADAVSLASSSASDVSTDTVTIIGLDVDGDLTTQTININGTTRVALTTALWRVLSMKWNGATANVGNIAVYTGTSTIPSVGDSKIRGWIAAGLNKTDMGIFTCPNDTVCFLSKYETGISRKGDAGSEIDLNLYVKKYGYPAYSMKPKINLANAGLSTYDYSFAHMYALPGKTDIRFHVDAYDASTDNLGVFSNFEIMSIDEKYFDSTYLGTIGQPGY